MVPQLKFEANRLRGFWVIIGHTNKQTNKDSYFIYRCSLASQVLVVMQLRTADCTKSYAPVQLTVHRVRYKRLCSVTVDLYKIFVFLFSWLYTGLGICTAVCTRDYVPVQLTDWIMYCYSWLYKELCTCKTDCTQGIG